MKKSQFKGILCLCIAAFIWGSSFVAQSIGMEKTEAFTYNGIRTLMGAATLLPIVLFREMKGAASASPAGRKKTVIGNRQVWIAGALLGLALCVASNFQQFAFNYTTSGKIAFITALYMLFVPVFGLALGKKPPALIWGCIVLAAAGLYFLSIPAGGMTALNRGDILSLICAAFFAVQILLVDRFAGDNDPIMLSFVQFLVSGAISCALMFIFETPKISQINEAILPLLYSGVMSCGVAYTLQVVGQKHTESTLASLIMCTESVFGVLSAAVILHEIPTGREIAGCAMMLTAIVSAQMAGRVKKRPGSA